MRAFPGTLLSLVLPSLPILVSVARPYLLDEYGFVANVAIIVALVYIGYVLWVASMPVAQGNPR